MCKYPYEYCTNTLYRRSVISSLVPSVPKVTPCLRINNLGCMMWLVQISLLPWFVPAISVTSGTTCICHQSVPVINSEVPERQEVCIKPYQPGHYPGSQSQSQCRSSVPSQGPISVLSQSSHCPPIVGLSLSCGQQQYRHIRSQNIHNRHGTVCGGWDKCNILSLDPGKYNLC